MDTRVEPPSLELQAILDAAVDAVILIDHQGIVQVFNHSAERLFGYNAEDVLGRNVSLLMSGPDRAQHDVYLQRYLRTGVAHIIGIGREVQARKRDGELFPAFLSVGQIGGSDPPRFVGFIQDITARQRALAEVQLERDRANQYLEAAQTILLALDLDHRVTLVNRKGVEILGGDERTLLGLDWFETHVPSDERPRVLREFEQLLAQTPHRPQHCEYPVLTRDDSPRLIAWRCVVIKGATGSPTGVLCSGDDSPRPVALSTTRERRANA